MTSREELLQYLADYPIRNQACRAQPDSSDNGRLNNSAECWAFVAGSMVGILVHTVFVWFTG